MVVTKKNNIVHNKEIEVSGLKIKTSSHSESTRDTFH